MRFPEDRFQRILNLSQSKVALFDNACSTLTPRGVFWIDFLGRLLRGQEGFAIQGLWLPDEMLQRVSGSLSLNLSGNSVHVLCVLKHLLVVLCMQGFILRRSLELQPVPRPMSIKRIEAKRRKLVCLSQRGTVGTISKHIDWGLFSCDEGAGDSISLNDVKLSGICSHIATASSSNNLSLNHCVDWGAFGI